MVSLEDLKQLMEKLESYQAEIKLDNRKNSNQMNFNHSEIKNQMAIINEEIDAVKISQDLINLKFEENVRETRNIKQNQRKIDSKVEDIEDNSRFLYDKCNYLENQIIDMKQKPFNSTVTITDTGKKEDEDIKDIVELIFKHLGKQSHIKEITEIWRLGRDQSGPIAVKMSNVNAKTQLLVAMGKKSLYTDEVGINKERKQFWINNYLIPELSNLLSQAKKQLRPEYKYVWANHGKIMAKKGDGTTVHYIYRSEDIDNLQEMTKRNNDNHEHKALENIHHNQQQIQHTKNPHKPDSQQAQSSNSHQSELDTTFSEVVLKTSKKRQFTQNISDDEDEDDISEMETDAQSNGPELKPSINKKSKKNIKIIPPKDKKNINSPENASQRQTYSRTVKTGHYPNFSK